MRESVRCPRALHFMAYDPQFVEAALAKQGLKLRERIQIFEYVASRNTFETWRDVDRVIFVFDANGLKL